MDIDEIFKRPPLPKSFAKRKFEYTEPSAALAGSSKLSKLDSVVKTSSPSSNSTSSLAGKGKGPVTIRDGSDDEDEDKDGSDEVEFAPGGDADYFIEEDEDGRFFGGGLNDVQKQVLNIMDHGADKDGIFGAGDLSSSGIKKQLLGLEKVIKLNREMRTRHGDDPEKFVDSEFSLLESLRSLLLLSSVPSTSYPQILQQSSLPRLADLLLHENTDVVIAVVELLEEWVDEEVLEVDDEDEEEIEDEEEEGRSTNRNAEEGERRREAMEALVDGVVNANIVELVIGGVDRFDEKDETERGGIYHTLSLIENLITLSPKTALPMLSPEAKFFPFLIKRFSTPSPPSSPELDQNRFYAAELFSILISLRAGDDKVDQAILDVRERMVQNHDVVELLLKAVSVYRRRDPSGADELEFMENLFDSLCTLMGSSSTKQNFIEGEGTELMCIMLKEKTRLSRTRAVKVLDFAMQGGSEECRVISERFVDRLGLKTLFSLFMGKSGPVDRKKNAIGGGTTREDLEHVLSIISSLFTALPSESSHRLRLLAKFVENDYEKVDRLLEVREETEIRVNTRSEQEENDDDVELDEEDIYLDKLDKGLFSLQLVDYVIGWLCMEDDGVRDHIKMLLQRKGETLAPIINVLIEYRQNLGSPSLASSSLSSQTTNTADNGRTGVNGGTENGKSHVEKNEGSIEQKEILDHLIRYLESLV